MVKLINYSKFLNLVEIIFFIDIFIIYVGHEQIVDLLIKNNVEINFQDSDQWTALHAACDEGNTII